MSTAIAALDKAQNQSPKLTGTKKSVLIIEDDLSTIEFFENVLDHLRPGLNCDYATSAEKAMALIRANGRVNEDSPYSLVIADIFLEGDMTGFDSWLDCAEEFPDMPFVITSSLSLDRYLAILSGFNSCPTFLPKPLTVGRCRAIIDEYI